MSSLREQFFSNTGMGVNPLKALLEADAPLPMLPTGGVDGAGNNGLEVQPGVGSRGPGPGQLGVPGQSAQDMQEEDPVQPGVSDDEYQQITQFFTDAMVQSVEYDLDSESSPYEAPSSDSPGDPGMYWTMKCIMLPHGRELYLKTGATEDNPNGVDYNELLSELLHKTDVMPRGFQVDSEAGGVSTGIHLVKELQQKAKDFKTGKYNGIVQFVTKHPDSMAIIISTDEEPEADFEP